MAKPAALAAALAAGLLAACAAAPSAARPCAVPGATWERRAPGDLGLQPAALRAALDWASRSTGAAVAVYRHGCLAGERGPGTAAEGWSMSKSVTSMLAGRAATLGRLDLDRPIAPLYPEADADHGALTPRQLLTMTSGLHLDRTRDLGPVSDRVREALSLPFDHPPGTRWEYAQSPVTLLADTVQRAVGRDFQAFAQDELFGPLGIARGAWRWDRDRAGHTQAWAHLRMRAGDWARLGQLMLWRGRWGARRLLSERYVAQALTRLRVNGGYGLLFWLNGGSSYALPGFVGQARGQLLPGAPRDLYMMEGRYGQRVYVIPSRDMVLVRMGGPPHLDGQLVRRFTAAASR
jgi:CubicO group peptidase (beta-lactamase class C family)